MPDGFALASRPSAVPIDRLSLVVVRIDHHAGNDNAYLFVNPTLGVEPEISTADATSLGIYDFSFNQVRPFANQGIPNVPDAEISIDELRIGTSYADVTPIVPEPAALTLVGLGVVGSIRRGRR